MYHFYSEKDHFFFYTESRALYLVKFEPDKEILSIDPTFQEFKQDFVEITFTVLEGKVDLKDDRISQTIIGIAKLWITDRNKILFFICSSVDRTAKARMKLFEMWAKSENNFVEFSKERLIGNDKINSEVGAIVRLDYNNIDQFRICRDQFFAKQNEEK